MYNPIQFEDINYKPIKRHIIKLQNESELVTLLIEKGWLKSRKTAAAALLFVSVSFILIAAFFFTEGKVFGFNLSLDGRVADQPYFVTIPGVDEPIKVLPGEDLGEVIKKHQ